MFIRIRVDSLILINLVNLCQIVAPNTCKPTPGDIIKLSFTFSGSLRTAPLPLFSHRFTVRYNEPLGGGVVAAGRVPFVTGTLRFFYKTPVHTFEVLLN